MDVITAMREEASAEAATAGTPPAREQVGLEDATIRVAAGLTGAKGAERRQAISSVQVGKTVTGQGVVKTGLTREQKLARALDWAKTLTPDQRDAFMVSDKFEALSDRQQELLSEAIGQIEDRAYEDSIGIADYDFDQEPVDVDALTADEDGEDEVVDDSDSDFETMFEQAAWEAE
jgi:hypothetical protein